MQALHITTKLSPFGCMTVSCGPPLLGLHVGVTCGMRKIANDCPTKKTCLIALPHKDTQQHLSVHNNQCHTTGFKKCTHPSPHKPQSSNLHTRYVLDVWWLMMEDGGLDRLWADGGLDRLAFCGLLDLLLKLPVLMPGQMPAEYLQQ